MRVRVDSERYSWAECREQFETWRSSPKAGADGRRTRHAQTRTLTLKRTFNVEEIPDRRPPTAGLLRSRSPCRCAAGPGNDASTLTTLALGSNGLLRFRGRGQRSRASGSGDEQRGCKLRVRAPARPCSVLAAPFENERNVVHATRSRTTPDANRREARQRMAHSSSKAARRAAKAERALPQVVCVTAGCRCPRRRERRAHRSLAKHVDAESPHALA